MTVEGFGTFLAIALAILAPFALVWGVGAFIAFDPLWMVHDMGARITYLAICVFILIVGIGACA